jgi:hypothetical protein
MNLTSLTVTIDGDAVVVAASEVALVTATFDELRVTSKEE